MKRLRTAAKRERRDVFSLSPQWGVHPCWVAYPNQVRPRLFLPVYSIGNPSVAGGAAKIGVALYLDDAARKVDQVGAKIECHARRVAFQMVEVALVTELIKGQFRKTRFGP